MLFNKNYGICKYIFVATTRFFLHDPWFETFFFAILKLLKVFYLDIW